MAQRIPYVIKKYQDRLREMPYVPITSFGRDSLGYSGEANKLSLTFLFSNHDIRLQLLKDVGLIRSKVQCNSCCRDMTWYADPSAIDGFRWRCRRMVAGSGKLHNRGSNLSLTDTCVAAVVVIQVFISTYNTHRSPSPRFPCNAHNASALPVALKHRLVLSSKGLSGVFLIPSDEWWKISVKLFMITRNACRRCRACRGFHTDFGCCKKTVRLTGCFSRSYSVTSGTLYSFLMTCAFFGLRCTAE